MLNSDELYERLTSSLQIDPSKIVGCNQDELRQIQSLATRPLPQSYLDFMARFGKGAGRFLRDIDIYYPDLLELRDVANCIVDRSSRFCYPISLPPHAFVYATRQGEDLWFFDLADDSVECPVWHFFEGRESFTKAADCFCDAIEADLRFSQACYDEVKDTPFFSE